MLTSSTTFEHLLDLFARDAQTVVRYRQFAAIARHEGWDGAAAVMERLADAQMTLAEGHMDLIRDVCDPLCRRPIGSTLENVEAALETEAYEARICCASGAGTADAEGYVAAVSWFRTVAAAKRQNAALLESLLEPQRKEARVRS